MNSSKEVPIKYASQYESLRELTEDVERVHREEMTQLFVKADMLGILENEVAYLDYDIKLSALKGMADVTEEELLSNYQSIPGSKEALTS